MDDELQEAIALDVRRKIYDSIDLNPGLHFREIQRRTGIATGALQYHLDVLGKKHLVRTVKEGKFVRYYSIRGKQLGEDQALMNILRQDSLRKILLFLLQKKRATNTVIAQNVGLSLSTTFWHLNKLVSSGIVRKKQANGKTRFEVADKERIASLLSTYKSSFLDSLVDSFVEVWEGLEAEQPAKEK